MLHFLADIVWPKTFFNISLCILHFLLSIKNYQIVFQDANYEDCLKCLNIEFTKEIFYNLLFWFPKSCHFLVFYLFVAIFYIMNWNPKNKSPFSIICNRVLIFNMVFLEILLHNLLPFVFGVFPFIMKKYLFLYVLAIKV